MTRSTEVNRMGKIVNAPKMHVADLQIDAALHKGETGSLAVDMKILMPEGELGRAAIILRDKERELLFHNMLLPGNMRMPMPKGERTGKMQEVQAQMTSRDVGNVMPQEREAVKKYFLYIQLYNDADVLIEEVCCPVRFLT